MVTQNVGQPSLSKPGLILEHHASLENCSPLNLTLLIMAKQCLICLKQFNSKAALKCHTGTADPTLRKPHVCRKCDRPFCSQRAMEQHRDSPSHTTFSCDICKKTFGSKKAVADHQNSVRHKSSAHWGGLPHRDSIGAVTSAGNVRFHSVLK
jgi:hypothetical protein